MRVDCGTPGTLRYCDGKGCKNRYHPPCSDPSHEYLYTGILFCTNCTGKRFQFGLHYIVDAIESVWDVKETEGIQNKQYFVKYRNLAHVHNRWVPEGDINATPGGRDLISLFNKRNHTEKTILKPEWTMPHRLLRKRLLEAPKLTDEFFCSSGDNDSYCTLEWLVKWRDLGYDHATWELATLACLCTPEAGKLSLEENIVFEYWSRPDCVLESLPGECRNTEHVERDNIANPSMLLRGTISVVEGVSASYDGTLDADQVCLELPFLASSIPTRDDQPAEAEGAGILGAVAAQDLQLEMQPSTSMQDIPSESIPIHQSVEPSLNPHAGVESAHTSGVVTAHDLQAEIQPSVSMQDRPAEAGSDMLGTTSAQGLQPEMCPSTTEQLVPHERTRSEEKIRDGFPPNMAPRPGQPTQFSQVTTSVSKNPGMENELLDWLNHRHTLLSKDHEQKISRLLEEYNQEIDKVFHKKEEIDKVNLKYGSLVLEEKNTFLRGKKELDDIYRKVFLKQSVAVNFPTMFTPSSASQGGILEEQLDSSSATQTSVSPVISSLDIQLLVGPYVRPSLVAQPSSSQIVQPQPTISSNLYGASTSSHFVPASVPHGSFVAQPRVVQPQPILPSNLYRMSPPSMMTSYGSTRAQLRAPAPHLQQFGMRPPYVATLANQQHLSATPAGEQYAAGLMGATSRQAGGILTSMAPSSVHHHTISSASRLRPALPAASSLPYGRRESSMANILRSSSSNPTFVAATQQSADPNIVLGSTTAPLNAAPGSQHADARIAGRVNQPGSQSALPNAHLPARLGLTSSSAGTGQGPSTNRAPVRRQQQR